MSWQEAAVGPGTVAVETVVATCSEAELPGGVEGTTDVGVTAVPFCEQPNRVTTPTPTIANIFNVGLVAARFRMGSSSCSARSLIVAAPRFTRITPV